MWGPEGSAVGPSGSEQEVLELLIAVVAVIEPELCQAVVGEKCESKHVQQAWQNERIRGATAGVTERDFP